MATSHASGRDIYAITKKYPEEEIFELSAQTKRAAISIPSNIAEGCGRRYRKDSLQFFFIARGSLYETESLINVALMVGIISETEFKQIENSIDQAQPLLNGLIAILKTQQRSTTLKVKEAC